MNEFTEAEVEEALGARLGSWANKCHEASLQIVRSGLVEGRVCRGHAAGVRSQHSWVIEGMDCYDPEAPIMDPTIWSYVPTIEGVWYGTYEDEIHFPHGMGSIWDYGKPQSTGGDPVGLVGEDDLSEDARSFLGLLGPLDARGWSVLIHAPVGRYPSREIIGAICNTPKLRCLVPIDIEGMLTDRNPGGLYLKESA